MQLILELRFKKEMTHPCSVILLHHYIDEGLKGEYHMVKDLFILWNNLKEQLKPSSGIIQRHDLEKG